MRKFTKKEDRFLEENYIKIPTKRMGKMLGRAESVARQRLKVLGLVVPPEIVSKFKQESYFKKGNISHNKGKKMPKRVYEKIKGSMFKKGHASHNKLPLGSQRVTKDGYLEIKTREPNKWEAYHRLMWEETFGQIPKDGVIRFVTNDKMNVHPFNLELINRSKNMKLNSYHNYPKEIQLVIQLQGALTRQINKHEKHI